MGADLYDAASCHCIVVSNRWVINHFGFGNSTAGDGRIGDTHSGEAVPVFDWPIHDDITAKAPA